MFARSGNLSELQGGVDLVDQGAAHATQFVACGVLGLSEIGFCRNVENNPVALVPIAFVPAMLGHEVDLVALRHLLGIAIVVLTEDILAVIAQISTYQVVVNNAILLASNNTWVINNLRQSHLLRQRSLEGDFVEGTTIDAYFNFINVGYIETIGSEVKCFCSACCLALSSIVCR